ncbi:MAG: hypothetical protein AABZ94_01025 [Candidatus Eisenbacteria bacterium]
MAFALFFVWEASPSHAEEPQEPVAPLALYALAPDSTASSPGPSSKPSEPPASSLTTAGSVPAPVTPSESAAGTAPTETIDATAAPKGDPTVTPKMESPAAPKPAARNVRKGKRTASAATKPKQPAAEPPDEGVRARQELERTEPILRSVKAKVVRSFNKKAREEFETATARQREAREALGENLYARAERLTMEARSIAREIAVHLGPPEDDADYVAMTLDRTDDALGRAREVLREAGTAPERNRLTALERRQKEARRLYKDGSTRRAYASTREVRDGVLTLLRECDELPVREETAEKALKRASRSLEQAKGELGERLNPAAERLAREARAQMAKARVAFARKNYRDTLLHSKLVERNLELAVSAQRSSTNRSG